MTTTTLSKVDMTQLDSNGNGTIILRPDVGQNWAPLFVRVSTNNPASPVAHCTVYHGSPGVNVQPSQYIDDTFLGNGDTSSMISGTAIRFGEAVIFTFTGGNPGDTATATVYGLQSDLPPNFDLIPQVPGTHFAGHPNTEITLTARFIRQANAVTVNPGQQVFLSSSPFAADDVREFSSYYLKIYALASPGNATAYNPSNVTLSWYAINDISNVDTLIYQESIYWWSDSLAGGFVAINGPLMMQDAMHGPYLVVTYQNADTTDTVAVFAVLEYTTRQIPGPYFRQQSGIDGTLVYQPAAGGPLNVPCPFHYGRLWVRGTSLGAGTTNFSMLLCGTSTIFELLNPAAGTTTRQELIVPKRALLFTMSNTTYSLFSHALYDRS